MRLTKRQKELLDFIKIFMDEYEYAPSIGDIQKEFSMNSPATVHQHLENLVLKGRIKKVPHQHRSIEIVPELPEWRGGVKVPVLGYIAAGSPIKSYDGDESVEVPKEMVGKAKTFILKVRGDSMVDDHIVDGDMVVVRQSDRAKQGNTVVALIDEDESTLKRFYPENGKVRLQPANSNMKPMIFDSSRVRIQGVVVGILRKY